jgi:hypothetical protein
MFMGAGAAYLDDSDERALLCDPIVSVRDDERTSLTVVVDGNLMDGIGAVGLIGVVLLVSVDGVVLGPPGLLIRFSLNSAR